MTSMDRALLLEQVLTMLGGTCRRRDVILAGIERNQIDLRGALRGVDMLDGICQHITAAGWRLDTIDVGHNGLRRLPPSVCRLPGLRTLCAGYNLLEHLPSAVDGFTHLEDLWLDHNRLIDLPESLAKLASLRLLSVRDNKWLHMPITILKAGICIRR